MQYGHHLYTSGYTDCPQKLDFLLGLVIGSLIFPICHLVQEDIENESTLFYYCITYLKTAHLTLFEVIQGLFSITLLSIAM